MPRDGAPTKERILETAERLVIDNGYAGTSVDQVIAESHTSKGAFFHHFSSKADLARSLVARYVGADVAHLESALAEVSEIEDPAARLVRFVQIFEDGAADLMSAQSSCLYVAILTERQLVLDGTSEQILEAVEAWRLGIAALVRAALGDGGDEESPGSQAVSDEDIDALADHVFVTFEGAFILCRSTGEPDHMRRQLRALRQLLEGWLIAHHASAG